MSWATNQDYIGGAESRAAQQLFGRRADNAFFIKTSYNIWWQGRISEAATQWIRANQTGTPVVQNMLLQTSNNQAGTDGGMTRAYQTLTEDMRAMYPVMLCPSGVHLGGVNGRKDGRGIQTVKERFTYNNIFPKFLPPQTHKAKQ